MSLLIGLGDAFTHNKQHWVVVDIKGNDIICKNKVTGAVVTFSKETIIDSLK